MEELIVSVVSLLILVPIIYFLPLGLTNKGKGIVIIIAFIFANLAILAKNSFSLWQTGLIILLLTFLTVYILDKKFSKFLFSSKKSHDKEADFFDENIEIEEDTQNLDEDIAPNNNIDTNLGVEAITLEKFEHEHSSIEEIPAEPETILNVEMKEEDTTESMVNDDLVAEDEIAFLMNREELLEEVELEPISEAEAAQLDEYLSDIEQLLEEEDLEELELNQNNELPELPESSEQEAVDLDLLEEFEDLHLSTAEMEQDSLSAQTTSEEDVTSDTEIEILHLEEMEENLENNSPSIDDEYAWLLDSDLDNDELLFEDDISFDNLDELEMVQNEVAASMDNIEQKASLDEDLYIWSNEEISSEDTEYQIVEDEEESLYGEPEKEISSNLDEAATEERQGETPTDLLDVEILEEIDMENTSEESLDEATLEPVNKEEEKSILQQQLFHTMISQLHIARKQLKANEYEDLIMNHLHPELPAQDYYTFASLLIEHYISNKEIDKLKDLLTNLANMFKKYPILDMEIHYLYKQYCEKTR